MAMFNKPNGRYIILYIYIYILYGYMDMVFPYYIYISPEYQVYMGLSSGCSASIGNLCGIMDYRSRNSICV